MHLDTGSRRRLAGLAALVALTAATALATTASTASASMSIRKVWMQGFTAPNTPERLDKVGAIEVGSKSAKNVLVFEPGTSAAAAYFIPLAKWLVEKMPNWQVWAVERRENRLEDQSELNKYKKGEVTAQQFFRYYLGYLSEPDSERHLNPLQNKAAVADGGREWGMNVAVQDLHVIIEAAKSLGGKVVLGGHSLGGSVVTAYATWDFGGKPGADGLSGLVYDDGGSSPLPISAKEAEQELTNLAGKTPWFAFGGIGAPELGLFSMTGSATATLDPNEASQAESFPYLPGLLKPKNSKGEEVPATNEATFGYGVNVGTSPPTLAAAQVHAGKGIEEAGPGEPWVWN
ncbi:MAG TPA: hypothetical protein VKG62_01760, partial [Solirubrobacteraceae bacterium]|nr:hypothetical protein [Solirubrobacteraceae bacterium]